MEILHILGSILMVFLLVAWVWVVISVITDIFRSKDLNGWSRSLWILFVIVMPWLGVFAYLLIRGDDMQKRTIEALQDVSEQQRAYIKDVAGVSTADELIKLGELKDKGVITDAEFEVQKIKLLGNS
ncbi:MAG: SHOCT domain-containing protein [Campylobacterota bacterium]|nr:SHOCT domain-containing protein [Campylobacterota bacterium]